MLPKMPQPGDVLHVSSAASVQFGGASAMTFRVIGVDPVVTYEGWLWLDSYQLGPAGEAIERRKIFVRRIGLRLLEGRSSAVPRPTNAGPARQQRRTPVGERQRQ